MLELVLGQLAIVGALSCCVIAVLWPHVSPLLKKLVKSTQVTAYLGNKLFNLNQDKQQDDIELHLGPEGAKRLSYEKKTIYSLDTVSEQTPLLLADTAKDFHTKDRSSHARSAILTTGGQAGFTSFNRSSSSGGPATLFIIFTVVVIGLIVYTMARMVSSRLGSRDNRHRPSLGHTHNADGRSRLKSREQMSEGESVPWRNKHDLLKMSKEDRVKQLILHHGSRNVSAAVGFLKVELEEHKKSILESFIAKSPCYCSCHDTSEHKLN